MLAAPTLIEGYNGQVVMWPSSSSSSSSNPYISYIPTRIAIKWCTKLLAPLYRTKPVRPRPNLRSWGLSSVLYGRFFLCSMSEASRSICRWGHSSRYFCRLSAVTGALAPFDSDPLASRRC